MTRFITHRNGFWLLLIVSLAFNAGFGTTYGVHHLRNHFHGGKGGHHRGWGGLHGRLHLDHDQQTTIEASGEKLFEHMAELRHAMHNEQQAMAELITSEDPNDEAITAQLDKIGELHQGILRGVVAHFLEVKKLLGPDQIEDFHKMIRQHIYRHAGAGLEHGSPPHGDRAHRKGHGKRREHDD